MAITRRSPRATNHSPLTALRARRACAESGPRRWSRRPVAIPPGWIGHINGVIAIRVISDVPAITDVPGKFRTPVYTGHITGLSSVAGGCGRAGGRLRSSRPLTRGAAAHAPPRRRRDFRRRCCQQPQWPQRPPGSSAPSKMGRVLDSHAGVRAGTGAGGSTGRPRWRRIFSLDTTAPRSTRDIRSVQLITPSRPKAVARGDGCQSAVAGRRIPDRQHREPCSCSWSPRRARDTSPHRSAW